MKAITKTLLSALLFAAASTSATLHAGEDKEIFFTGKSYDADLKEYTFLFRNYDPETARWTTSDPSGFPDGANGYLYAPSPTNELDPFGLWKVKVTSSSSTDSWSDNVFYDGIAWGNDYLKGMGSLTADSAPHTAVDSITVSGTAIAYWLEASWGHQINQSYNITVSSSGELSVEPGGSTKKEGSETGIAIATDKSFGSGNRTLTLTYNVAAAHEYTGVTGVGGNVHGGSGGSLSWTSPAAAIEGMVSLTFEAVE